MVLPALALFQLLRSLEHGVGRGKNETGSNGFKPELDGRMRSCQRCVVLTYAVNASGSQSYSLCAI